MSFGSYFLNGYTEAGVAVLAVTSAWTWWKGGPAERLGTLIYGIGWLGADAWRALSNQSVPVIPMFVSDIAMSLGFLYIAIRYSSLWVGAAMLLQAGNFYLHAAGLADPSRPRWHGMIIYLLANNILSYLILLALASGTLATILKRQRDSRRKAEAAAKAAGRAAAKLAGLTKPTTPFASTS